MEKLKQYKVNGKLFQVSGGTLCQSFYVLSMYEYLNGKR